MKDYRKLTIWKLSHTLALNVYSATKSFPKDELFGLTSQLRRAAMSIPANLAEGCGRNGDAELRRFAFIALGSASELDYEILLATDLGYLAKETGARLAEDTLQLRRMMGAFVSKLSP
ncbi:four helix bundle protein [Opitutus sp. ER46]|uniref:four helix bundle protein n=1 Tax=Opitutus sp. ER46 TaxID=2161864 RepID=UPI000D31474E|nr:four helix bundle protein [Opitutus sp. ER46]PTX98554.1 diversity-generating retroelement protein bAvd family protein [Opitutus sp. ER46]